MGDVTADLEQLLRDAFPEATEIRVSDRTGGGDHFQVEVTSPRFDGLAHPHAGGLGPAVTSAAAMKGKELSPLHAPVSRGHQRHEHLSCTGHAVLRDFDTTDSLATLPQRLRPKVLPSG